MKSPILAKALLGICLSLLVSAHAIADTFIIAGAKIDLPDGWSVKNEGKLHTLLPPKKGAFIEVYRFSKVPAADKAPLLKMMKPRRNTTEITLDDASVVEQHGLQGTTASGSAKIKGTPVGFKLVGLPIDDHAVLAIGFMSKARAGEFKDEFDAILGSIQKQTQK